MFSWVKNLIGHARGIGGCLCCGDRWSWKPIHSTYYSSSRGCFPLCESCWQAASSSEIRRYYSEIVKLWRRGGSLYSQEKEDGIVAAALKEKGFLV